MESMPEAGLEGHLSGQHDLEPPNNTAQHNFSVYTSQYIPWKKYKEIVFKPILCVRSNSAIVLIHHLA